MRHKCINKQTVSNWRYWPEKIAAHDDDWFEHELDRAERGVTDNHGKVNAMAWRMRLRMVSNEIARRGLKL